MWYEKNYRRHLCDMHIEDWNEEFLSKFSPEEYVENLLNAKIQNAMKGSGSHKYQDLDRSCGVCGCWNDAVPDKMHCSEHIAEMNEEIDLCKYNGCTFEAKRDGYCLTHKATKANERYRTCVKKDV